MSSYVKLQEISTIPAAPSRSKLKTTRNIFFLEKCKLETVNETELNEDQISAMFLRAIHKTREPEKVPGRKKKVPAETIHDPAPEKEKSRKEEPVSEWKTGNTFDPRIPRKEKRKKRPLYHDIHLVQTDLFKFFPQNQSNLAEYFVMEGGGRIVSTPRRKS